MGAVFLDPAGGAALAGENGSGVPAAWVPMGAVWSTMDASNVGSDFSAQTASNGRTERAGGKQPIAVSSGPGEPARAAATNGNAGPSFVRAISAVTSGEACALCAGELAVAGSACRNGST